jgi:hypothetical protein
MGSVLQYCDPDSNQLVTEDCATYAFPDAGEIFTCQFIDASWGYDCAAPVGGNCFDSGGFIDFCQGTDPGCVLGSTTTACQDNLPTCVSYDDDGGFALSGTAPNLTACSSNLLEESCNEDQLVAQDCVALGATCGAIGDGGAGCLGLPAGQECDNVEFFCASGEACADPDAGGVSYCQ